MDAAHLERVLERERPRFLVVTSNFQNPTGATLPLAGRGARCWMPRARPACRWSRTMPMASCAISGEPLPAHQATGRGRRHGAAAQLFEDQLSRACAWAGRSGPKPLIDRLRQAKEAADLHTDQLSQAVLLEFAESGRLEAHRARVLRGGRRTAGGHAGAAREYLPAGTRWTRPEGGMNVWVRLPEPLDAGELLARAQKEGVAYLPGRYFAVSRLEPGALRLSFAGLPPEQIRSGLAILGRIVAGELESAARNLRARAGHGLDERIEESEHVSVFERTVSSEGRAGGDAEGRRHHGRHQRRAGQDRGRRRRLGGDGAGARARPTSAKKAAWRAWRNIAIIEEIMKTVTIPVMAKARIGHFMEARILEALGVDYIDESEVLTPADEEHHIDKNDFKVPFVCGARNLGEALRRIAEGAAMIRTKGEAGSRQHRRSRAPHPHHRQGDEAAHRARQGRAGARGQEPAGAARTGGMGGASTASCRCRTSRRAASPRRPMPRW